MTATATARLSAPDSSLPFALDPYRYIAEHARTHGSDILEGRFLLRPAIFMTGPENARLFYDRSRFIRKDAAPRLAQKTLFGEGGVQALDDDEHRHRKAMFMFVMTPEKIGRLTEIMRGYFKEAIHRWQNTERIVLYDESQEIITRSVCRWAGVPLPESEVESHTRTLRALFHDAGALGPDHFRSRAARKRADRWAAEIINDIRDHRINPAPDDPAAVIAAHRDPAGVLLPTEIAGVELLNLLRPTVAVSVYIAWIAHALHQNPRCAARLRSDDPADAGYADLFVQEVRRFYPFFPAVVARVRDDFEHNGHRFPKGRLVVLDLYGTNHDPRTWDNPGEFNPERFRNWNKCPFNHIPQGGGDHHTNHRCAGEWITIALMKLALEMLVSEMTYTVPDQDMSITFNKLPALPADHMILAGVRGDG